jgi:hypothetical protein
LRLCQRLRREGAGVEYDASSSCCGLLLPLLVTGSRRSRSSSVSAIFIVIFVIDMCTSCDWPRCCPHHRLLLQLR